MAHHVQIVVHHQQRVPCIQQAVPGLEQNGHVGGVQARGGLVQGDEGGAAAGAGQLCGQLHPLGFAAGERGRGLAQGQVAQAHLQQGAEDAAQPRVVREVRCGLRDAALQHVRDAPPPHLHGQHLGVEAPPAAGFADQLHAPQVAHADFLHPSALAGFAAAAHRVEGEAPLAQAPGLGVRRAGEEVPDEVEGAAVGGGIGAGGAADGVRIHGDDAAEGRVLHAARLETRHHLVEEGGLPRPRDARDHMEEAHLQGYVEVLEVVAVQAFQSQRGSTRPQAPGYGLEGARQPALRGRGGLTRSLLQQLPRGAAEEQPSALDAGPGAQVDEPVGRPGDVGIVLHHHHGLALVPQTAQHTDQAAHVVGMEARRGLVQHHQQAAQLAQGQAQQPQALRLAAREARHWAIQRQVVETQLGHQVTAAEEVLADGLQHGGFAGFCLDGAQEGPQLPDRQGGEIHDAPVPPGDGQRLGPQARAVAGRAGGATHEAQDGVVALAPEDLLHDGHEAAVEALLAGPRGDAGPLQARF